jgi:crotonobetainyl-CoA:carnitine CoA-transferase CaiB-like acyl-CoA transferase
VWYDEAELRVGDSLYETIDAGLARSDFAIVILSPHFFTSPLVEITPSPLLSEHTAEVLREVMGYDKEKVDQLRQEGVV